MFFDLAKSDIYYIDTIEGLYTGVEERDNDYFIYESDFPSESVDLIYIDPPFNTGKPRKGPKGSYGDNLGEDSYLEWLRTTLLGCHRVLSKHGQIFVHCDERMNYKIRLLLDNIFGANRFINEIIWAYNSGGASKKRFSAKHDTIYRYSKSSEWRQNEMREPYPHKYKGKAFHPDGRLMTDTWDMSDYWQVSFIGTSSGERTGYPTQKPERLLERIIEVATLPGDVVLDPCVGSGTTVAVAHRLRRIGIGLDINPDAVEIAKSRLTKIQFDEEE